MSYYKIPPNDNTIIYKYDIAKPKPSKVFEHIFMGSAVSGQILGLRPANERQRYTVTLSLIGWVQA